MKGNAVKHTRNERRGHLVTDVITIRLADRHRSIVTP
jgi:hypothetical protein